MKRPIVAFHACLLDGGTPRGALRLFRNLVVELAQRDDIELVCLGKQLTDHQNPVNCVFERISKGEWLARFVENGVLVDFVSPAEPPAQATPAFFVPSIERPRQRKKKNYTWRDQPRRLYREMGRARRRFVTPKIVWFISALRRMGHLCKDTLRRSYNEFRQFWPRYFGGATTQPSDNSSGDTKPAQSLTYGRPDGLPISIETEVISINRIDVLLNFWWFHSPHPNPILGQYRPRNLRVLSWFLDTIPLRVAHWSPGMIPIDVFRYHVQAHLDAADEVVAISESAKSDISAFFPHIKKPIHVVPCGISPKVSRTTSGDAPEELSALGIAPHLPLFTFIGAQEPSKNLANAILGLLHASEQLQKELQAFIMGPGFNGDLSQLIGPSASRVQGRLRLVHPGLVSDRVKFSVLAASSALVYVSKWEGFGIPPLEAMQVGTPVISSDIPPLREVCGDLAEYCDPYDPIDISAAITRTLSMPAAARSEYANVAVKHALRYSWASAADILTVVITGDRERKIRNMPLKPKEVQLADQ